MVFSSFDFVLLFLPAVYLIFRLTNWVFPRVNGVVLLAASIAFYAYWSVLYLPLLLGSIAVNYVLGAFARNRRVMQLGVVLNLAVLFWYKYTHFVLGWFVDGPVLNDILPGLIIPLGISFYTFQQISYLVDINRGDAERTGPLTYAAYVSFFPQLIAGPIVRYKSIETQLNRLLRGIPTKRLSMLFVTGMVLFSIGLFKKVVLADSLAQWVDPVFAQTLAGTVSRTDAFIGAVGYTFQLYFDFSGYSDMALGLGRMFGLFLPLNFFSPLRARSIVQFWRRWHVSLSHFVRDYIYIPLGGNRRGAVRQGINLFVAFFIIGVWHGAGWTFVVWGTAHALAVVVATFWRRWPVFGKLPAMPSLVGIALTYSFAMLAFVPFRAENMGSSNRIFEGLLFSPESKPVFADPGMTQMGLIALAGAAIICFFLPNAIQWLGSRRHGLIVNQTVPAGKYVRTKRSRAIPMAITTGVMFYLAVTSMELDQSPFIYFNF